MRSGLQRLCCLVVACAAGVLLVQRDWARGQDGNQSNTVLRGHLAPVLMGAFTPDGVQAVTVSSDETVRVWNLADAAEIRRFTGHTGPLYCLALSGDGRTLVTGAQDNTLRLWDVPQSKPVSQFAGHAQAINALAVSPDGGTVISGGRDKSVTQWNADQIAITLEELANAQPGTAAVAAIFDARAGRPQAGLADRYQVRNGHEAAVTTAAYRGDGAYYATGDAAGRLLVWSPFLEADQGQLGAHPGGVTGLAFPNNNQQLVSAGADGNIRVWQLPITPAVQLPESSAAVVDLVIPVNQPTSIVASADGSVRLIDVNNAAVVREFPSLDQAPTSLAVKPDNTLVATGSSDGRVKLRAFGDGAVQPGLAGHSGAVTRIQFHADNARLATCGADGTVRLWSIPAAPTVLAGHTQPLTTLATSRNGQWFVTGAADKTVRVWAANGQAQRQMGNHLQAVQSVAIRADDAQIASGDEAGVIWLWNAATGAAEGSLSAQLGPVTSLAFAASNQVLFSGDSEGTIRRWQLPPVPARVSNGHSQPVQSIAVSPDGSVMVTGSSDQSVRIWKTANGEAVRTLSGATGAVQSVAISQDGQQAAAGTASGQLLVWGLTDGALRHQRTAAGQALLAVAFLPDGRHVATADAGNRLRIWELPEPGQESLTDAPAIQETALPDNAPYSLVLTPDGQTLYAGGAAPVVRAWRIADNRIVDPAPFKTLTGPTQRVTDLAISRDGKWLTASSADKTVQVWDLSSDQPAAARKFDHPAGVNAVAISADGSRVTAAGDDGAVYLWDRASGRLAERFTGQTQAVRCVDLTPDGKTVVSGGQDHSVQTFVAAVTAVMPAIRTDGKSQPVKQLVALSAELGIAAISASGTRVLRWKPDSTPLPSLDLPAGVVTAIAASPDGSRLVAANDQGQAFVWQVADGKLLGTLALDGNVSELEFSRDGSELAVADQQSRVRIYSLEPFRVREEIELPHPIHHLGWTAADGRSLATIGPQNEGHVVTRSLLRIWETGPRPQQAQDATPPATPIAFSPDGARVYAAAADGQIRQYRLSDGELERTLAGHPAGVSDLAVTPNGQQLLSAGRDQVLRQWNPNDGSLIRSIPVSAQPRRIAVRSDSQRAASITDDGQIQVWELASGQLLETMAAHRGAGTGIGWLNDGLTLVSGAADKSLLRSKTAALRAFPVHEQPMIQMALYNGGAQSITCAADGSVVMTDLNSGQLVRKFEGLTGKPVCVAVRSDNQRLAVGTSDGKLCIWNAGNAQLLQTLELASPAVAVTYSPDNQKLAVVDEQRVLRIFGPVVPPQTAEPGVELYLHQQVTVEHPLRQLVFAPDNRHVWSVGDDGIVSRWAYASPVQLRQFNHGGPVYGVAISRDGRTVVSCSTDQTVRIWDATTGQQKFQMNGHSGPVHAVALSPDESLVVSSGADKTLRLWDVVGGRQLKQLATLDETMYSVAVHPNGQLVAAAGADRLVHVFDLLTGDERQTLSGHTDYVHSVSFNPQGTRLLSYGYAGQLRVWDTADGKSLFDERVGTIGNDARYSADGSRVLLSNGDATARVFELPAAAR